MSVSSRCAQAGPRPFRVSACFDAGTSRAPRSARSPSGAALSGTASAGAVLTMRYSLGAASATISARLEISATPAPVRPIRGSRISVSPSTSAHNRPCSHASPAVRLWARNTAKYVSMTTRSTAPTANQRSSGVAASAYPWPKTARIQGAPKNSTPHTGSMIRTIRLSAARVFAARRDGSCEPSTVSEAPMLMASRLTVPPMVVVM